MYRVCKLSILRIYDMNEDVFHYYQIAFCELTVNFYFTRSLYYEIL